MSNVTPHFVVYYQLPSCPCFTVPRGVKCNPHYHDPVCDTDATEHTNACLLLQKDKKLAYRGHCQVCHK